MIRMTQELGLQAHLRNRGGDSGVSADATPGLRCYPSGVSCSPSPELCENSSSPLGRMGLITEVEQEKKSKNYVLRALLSMWTKAEQETQAHCYSLRRQGFHRPGWSGRADSGSQPRPPSGQPWQWQQASFLLLAHPRPPRLVACTSFLVQVGYFSLAYSTLTLRPGCIFPK